MNELDRVKEISKKKGWSLRLVEDKAGLGRNSLYRWKTSKPSGKGLEAVARVLNVSVDYLLGNESENKEIYYEALDVAHDYFILMNETSFSYRGVLEEAENYVSLLLHLEDKLSDEQKMDIYKVTQDGIGSFVETIPMSMSDDEIKNSTLMDEDEKSFFIKLKEINGKLTQAFYVREETSDQEREEIDISEALLAKLTNNVRFSLLGKDKNKKIETVNKLIEYAEFLTKD